MTLADAQGIQASATRVLEVAVQEHWGAVEARARDVLHHGIELEEAMRKAMAK